VPTAYEIGHVPLPHPATPGRAWLPGWARLAIPAAEEALLGGALLGLVAARPAWLGMRALLRCSTVRFHAGKFV